MLYVENKTVKMMQNLVNRMKYILTPNEFVLSTHQL